MNKHAWRTASLPVLLTTLAFSGTFAWSAMALAHENFEAIRSFTV